MINKQIRKAKINKSKVDGKNKVRNNWKIKIGIIAFSTTKTTFLSQGGRRYR